MEKITDKVSAMIRFAEPGKSVVFNAADRAKSQMPYEEHEVEIGDIRGFPKPLSFDDNGFLFLQNQPTNHDFHNPEAVEATYLPEIEALVRQLTGAEKTISFGVMVRTDRPGAPDGNKVAQFAHVDYGAQSVSDYTLDILGAEQAEYWLKRRHMLINFWRPIKPVERMPLALADASTIKPEHFVDIEVHGSLGDPNRRTTYGLNLTHKPDQRWWYASSMQPHEMWAFKLFDSDASKTQLTAHTAFVDPTSQRDAQPRESIEVRTISFMPE